MQEEDFFFGQAIGLKFQEGSSEVLHFGGWFCNLNTSDSRSEID